jgi:uncharacterized membrane protein
MRNIIALRPFAFSFFCTMIACTIVNAQPLQRALHHKTFDSYPHILLNPFLHARQSPRYGTADHRQARRFVPLSR